MKYFLSLSILFISCTQNPNNVGKTENEISPVRKQVNDKPVATYIIPMGDPKLDRKFGVKIYETSETFKFRLEMYYDAIVENDTIGFPNLGREPEIKIEPGSDSLSCIIGFLDDKKQFREYKLLSGKGDKLSLTKLKSYVVE